MKGTPKERAIKVLPAVVLINPKYPHNVGQTVRACASWNIPSLRWTGTRVDLEKIEGRIPREERMRAYRTVDFQQDEYNLFDRLPEGAVPVAIEVRPGSEDLPMFEHPEKAVYVFGPEDGSIPKGFMHVCHRFVVIPSIHCLNLASAVNVVMYDRRTKLGWDQGTKVLGRAV